LPKNQPVHAAANGAGLLVVTPRGATLFDPSGSMVRTVELPPLGDAINIVVAPLR
jgi:hypothetical protein